MAERKKRNGIDVPEGWEVVEEDEEAGNKREFHLSNNMLWVLFLVLIVAFAAVAFLIRAPPKEMETAYVNGIKITAPLDPLLAIKNLVNLHIEGKRLDETEDSHNALNEILVVMGQSNRPASGSAYTLFAGITDKTEISIRDRIVRIEGRDRPEFWKAIWTFNSIVGGLEIDSDIDMFEVQDLLKGREEVYLVQDMEDTCSNYGHIISAEGDILPPLGFKQAQTGFDLKHYQKEGDVCTSFANESESGDCPVPGEDVFVITMSRGESSLLEIKKDEILFQYSDCTTVDRISVILGDMLYPRIISSMATVKMPTEL